MCSTSVQGCHRGYTVADIASHLHSTILALIPWDAVLWVLFQSCRVISIQNILHLLDRLSAILPTYTTHRQYQPLPQD